MFVFPTIESIIVLLIAVFLYLEQYMIDGRYSLFFERMNKQEKAKELTFKSLSNTKLYLQEHVHFLSRWV